MRRRFILESPALTCESDPFSIWRPRAMRVISGVLRQPLQVCSVRLNRINIVDSPSINCESIDHQPATTREIYYDRRQWANLLLLLPLVVMVKSVTFLIRFASNYITESFRQKG